MAFRVWNNGIGVVDEERGIAVKMAFGRFDDTSEVPYEYTEQPPKGRENPHKVESLIFIFQTKAERKKLEDYVYEGQKWPRFETVATHVIERSLIQGLFDALGPKALEKVDLAHIKLAIKEAMYTSGTREGRRLNIVPEFKVDFR